MQFLGSTLLAALVVFGLLGCTPSGGGTAPGANTAPVLEKSIVIGSLGESMAFDKTELYVKAGEQITLTFQNNSASQKHNWVLIKPGSADKVGMEGIKAGEAKNYIPELPEVLAHTPLADPKTTKPSEVTITFTAPPAGDYPYICTFL
jgi:azurin